MIAAGPARALAHRFGLGPRTLLPYVVLGWSLGAADAAVLGAALQRFATLSASLASPAIAAEAARALPELAMLLGLHAGLGLGIGIVSTLAGDRAIGRIRAGLYDGIRLAFPVTRHDADIASLAATLTHDVNQLRSLVDAIVVGVVRNVLALAVLATVAARYGRESAAPVMLAFVAVGLVMLVIVRATRRLMHRVLAAASSHASRILERLRVRDVDYVHRRGLLATGRAEGIDRLPATLRELGRAERRFGIVVAVTRPAIELVLAATLTVVWMATAPVDAAEAASVAALVLAIRPISSVFAAAQGLPTALAAAERLNEVVVDLAPVARAASPIDAQGMLVLDALSVGYEARTLVSGLSGAVARGSAVVVVGPNGSGKTTLLGALVGARRPLDGRVTLGGVEPGDAVRSDGRAAIGYAPQVVELERGTTVEATGADSAPALEAAAYRAGFPGLVASLPASRDALGANGLGLSSGQRAKLAIARAFLVSPALVVLDEPTASLDAESSAALCAALRAYADGGAIVVVASHDPAVTAIANVLLDLGRAEPRFETLDSNART